MQLNLGRLLPSDSIRVYVEFPEFSPVSKDERQLLVSQGYIPQHDVQFHVHKGISRGETIADVSFFPVVLREGKWFKISNYKVKYEVTGPRLSHAIRQAMSAMQRASTSNRYAEHSVLANGKWVKIRVKEEGLYQLSSDQLKRMGFSDPSKVKLFGYGGRLLPEQFSFNGEDALIDDLCEVPLYRRENSVLFFAEGLVTPNSKGRIQRNTYSNYSYYFLTEGTDPVKFAVLPRSNSTHERVAEVRAFSYVDNDAFVWYGGGRDFYDTNELQNGVTYKMSFPGITDAECTIIYDATAKSSTSTTKLTISTAAEGVLASSTIGKFGEGESARGYRGSFKMKAGEEERFVVKTTNTGRLNYLSSAYTQHLSTQYTTGAFSTQTEGGVELNVAAADAQTRVWQLGTAEFVTAELPGELSNGIYKAYAESGRRRFVIVDISKTYPSPEIAGSIDNQDLHADRSLDYVIIVPGSGGNLYAEAERLAEAHRQHGGLRVKVVRADQIYNEFSSGTPDAGAYRRYMKMLYDRAETPQDMPKYLLLFGDCSYDNRMITPEYKGVNPDDFLLAYERNDHEDNFESGYSKGKMYDYVTDDYYGFLDDGEGANIKTEKIDLGIGRFICHNADDAKWLVNNSISYLRNSKTGAWKNKMWAIADVGDENLHMKDAQGVSSQVAKTANSDFMLRRIYPDAYNVTQEAKGATFPEATQKLKTAMQQGALIFNYNGHGSPDRLSHNFLLDKSDMTANVSAAAPVWFFASCDITPYDQITEDLGRNALFSPSGAAVAVVCASRSVYANYNKSFNMGFMKYAFAKDSDNRRYTFGDALRLAKCEMIKNTDEAIGTDLTMNKLKYALLGDPALALSYPDPGVVIDSINGTAVHPGTFEHIPVGQTVRFAGYVNADTDSSEPDSKFAGTLTATVYMPQQTITCKGYGNKRDDPLTYTDYTQILFEGTVEVKGGRFALEFMVPRGITFSNNNALLSLYAVNSDATCELNGSFKQFCLNGSATPEKPDTLGPEIYLYIDTPDFPDGGVTTADNSMFYAVVADSSALSMVSGNLGHDMEIWLDDDPSSTIVMNDFFSFDYGSYRKGIVEYPLSSLLLPRGRHKLSFRAWDVFDNSSTTSLHFVINDAARPDLDVISTETIPAVSTRFITSFINTAEAETEVVTEVFNAWGLRVWHGTAHVQAGSSYAVIDWSLSDYSRRRLDRGVYLYRSKIGNRKSKTKKMIIR